jgi:O-antigen ligase
MMPLKKNTRPILGFFVFIYIFSIHMTDTFSYNEKIPIYMFASLFIIITSVKKINLSIYGIEDYFLLLFVGWILFISLFNLNDKSFNYVMTYVYILLILYLFLKGLFYRNITIDFMLKANYYGTFFLVFFLIFEFSAQIFFDFDIQEYLPRRRDASATFLNLFYRSYGFSTEPGIVAYYLSTLGLISVWYIIYRINISKIKLTLLLVSFILAEVTIYSAAGIVALTIGFILSTLVLLNKKKIYKLILMIFSISVLLQLFSETIYTYTYPIINKISLSASSGSGADRLGRWTNAINQIQEHPITGIGLGGISANGDPSPVSWYLFLMVETGILSIIFLFIFYLFVAINIYSSNVDGKNILLASFIAGVLHLSVISTFHYPFIFLNIILISIIIKKSYTN